MRPVGGAVFAALWVLVSGCFSSGPGDSRTIRAKGNFEHRGAGLVLPARIGLLERKLIREFGGDPGDIGAYYTSVRSAEPVNVNLFLAPAGQPFPGRLKQQFVQRLSDLRRGGGKLTLRETRVLRAPGGTARAVGYEASYRSRAGETDVRTLLRVFQCGQWFFRIQASAREEDLALLDAAVDEIHATVSCEAIAAHSPAGDALEISIEPGVADRADWRAYAEGQLEWLRRNVSASSLSVGIPDHDLDLFVAAWKRALDVRAGQSGDRRPDALMHALESARQAGFLEEYLWSEHLSFLPAPPELELEGFRAWRAEQAISAPYQIRAGAVLVRSAGAAKP